MSNDPNIDKGKYFHFEIQRLIIDLHNSLRPDTSVQDSLRIIYTLFLKKLFLFMHCAKGIHIFSNVVFTPDGKKLETFEIDILDHTQDDGLRGFVLGKNNYFDLNKFPNYIPIKIRQLDSQKISEINKFITLIKILRGKKPAYESSVLSQSDIEEIKTTWSTLISLSDIKHEWLKGYLKSMLMIPLSMSYGNIEGTPTLKFPFGDLGTIFLMSDNEEWAKNILSKEEDLLQGVKEISCFIEKYFTSHYNALFKKDLIETTYLPSFRIPKEEMIAILFTDIRNFTPLTEIMRITNGKEHFKEFMQIYTLELSKIVEKHNGRIQSFTGDGIMAVFGEYSGQPNVFLQDAVDAAIEMLNKFNSLKNDFLKLKVIKEICKNRSEAIDDFSLGIGLNYGEVLFDYYGNEGNRIYNPFGDAVNFAQRLVGRAAKYNDDVGDMAAPILLSHTIYTRLSSAYRSKCKKTFFMMKGKPFKYTVYGLNEYS